MAGLWSIAVQAKSRPLGSDCRVEEKEGGRKEREEPKGERDYAPRVTMVVCVDIASKDAVLRSATFNVRVGVIVPRPCMWRRRARTFLDAD